MNDDFKILNIDTNQLNVSVRDISNMDIFMKELDSEVHNDLYLNKKNSSGGSKSSAGKLFGGMII